MLPPLLPSKDLPTKNSWATIKETYSSLHAIGMEVPGSNREREKEKASWKSFMPTKANPLLL